MPPAILKAFRYNQTHQIRTWSVSPRRNSPFAENRDLTPGPAASAAHPASHIQCINNFENPRIAGHPAAWTAHPATQTQCIKNLKTRGFRETLEATELHWKRLFLNEEHMRMGHRGESRDGRFRKPTGPAQFNFLKIGKTGGLRDTLETTELL